MNILICIKQVPDTNEISMDEEHHTLNRIGVPSIVNPFDAYALEIAATIKDACEETKIILVTMGPVQAENALRTCFAVAGEQGYLVTDQHFAGSDTLATSYILSHSIKAIERIEGHFDIILCGKQAIDGDTAQVGPELAEHLNYPQVTSVVEVRSEGDRILVKKETESGHELLSVVTPCLLTISKLAKELRIPSLKAKLSARRIPITRLTRDDLVAIDPKRIGLKGSPTRVVKTYTPKGKSSCKIFTADTLALSVATLVDKLQEEHLV